MRKYLRIYRRFFENALSYQAQYRGDSISSFFLNFLWVGMMFLTIHIFFLQTTTLGGWTKEQVYLMSIIWMIVDETFILFFNANLVEIPNTVTEGKLDIYITKPASTLFLISTKTIHLKTVYRLITYFILFFYVLLNFFTPLALVPLLLTFFLMFCGVMILYSFVLILNTLSFWFYRVENINELWFSLENIGQYPLSVIPKSIRFVFFTVLPIAFIAYVPALALFEKIYFGYSGIIFICTILLFLAATSFFRYGLKNYTSASS